MRNTTRLLSAVGCWLCACGVSVLVCSLPVHADGTMIDKIYHPYVQSLEKEFELRASIEDGSNRISDDRQTWRMGYGQALTDNWFAEGYLLGEQTSEQGSLELKGYALESLWQLTEQGEYALDAGVMVELEKVDSADLYEFSGTLLLEKDWNSWAATANLGFKYEFGADIVNEAEPVTALQWRYRYSSAFEPGIEFYKSENITGLGPVLMGEVRPVAGQKLHWETGLIAGLGNYTPDLTARLLLEYEF